MNKLQVYKKKNEEGQSLIEFAISLTLLLIMLAGIVDIGRIFFVYITIREAAQEGAAFASVCPANAAVETRVRTSSSWPIDLSTNNPNVTVNATIQPQIGVPLIVTVRYINFTLSMPFIGSFLGSQTIDIEANAQHLVLQFNCPDGNG